MCERESKTETSNTRLVPVRMPLAMHAELKRVAAEYRISVTAIVLRAVEKYMLECGWIETREDTPFSYYWKTKLKRMEGGKGV